MFSPLIVGLGAFACLIFALAIFLFGYAQRQAESDALNAHLKHTIERQTVSRSAQAANLGEPTTPPPPVKESTEAVLQRWLHAMGAQAWGVTSKTALYLLVMGAAVLVVVGWKAGALLAAMALLIYVLGAAFYFWKRLDNKRQKMLEQLPGFLDNMVRLITIGTSTHAAFQMSVSSAPVPLRAALQQASSSLSVSSNLGYALDQLERVWRLPEFGLLAAVFRMTTKYGGRTDLVLERVSSYIRDKHAAERELHAMSAEVRLSAWVLSLLPIVVGALIMVINDGYFLRMWNDASGRQMIMLAAGLELAGVALLYRLAKLR